MSQWDDLRPHIVNLSAGFLSDSGLYQTSLADLDALFQTHLPKYVEKTKKPKIVVFAHGGLVNEKAGLEIAQHHIPWWLANDIYPLYFVWETGPLETFFAVHHVPARRPFGVGEQLETLKEDANDAVFEAIARLVKGEQYWNQMKLWAAASVQQNGGATEVARRLAKYLSGTEKSIELHAIGHSAGAIFHSYFLPLCLSQPVSPLLKVKTLHFLAPAIRVDSFQERLMPLLARGIDDLTIYTMNDTAERKDVCEYNGFTAYCKSLLYLIYRVLEPEDDTPILGLEISLKDTKNVPDEVRAALKIGTPDEKVRWAPTKGVTESTSHGGFDEDAATMNSVLRQISGKAPLVPFALERKPLAIPASALEMAPPRSRRRTFSKSALEREISSLSADSNPREQARQALLQAMENFIRAYEPQEESQIR